jgi:hypothetical protein
MKNDFIQHILYDAKRQVYEDIYKAHAPNINIG